MARISPEDFATILKMEEEGTITPKQSRFLIRAYDEAAKTGRDVREIAGLIDKSYPQGDE